MADWLGQIPQGRHYILDEFGVPHPVPDLETWAAWQSQRPWHLAWTEVGAAAVSTIFLGYAIDRGDGLPALFETMIRGGALDGEQRRYVTRTEALLGHEAMVQRLRAEGGSR